MPHQQPVRSVRRSDNGCQPVAEAEGLVLCKAPAVVACTRATNLRNSNLLLSTGALVVREESRGTREEGAAVLKALNHVPLVWAEVPDVARPKVPGLRWPICALLHDGTPVMSMVPIQTLSQSTAATTGRPGAPQTCSTMTLEHHDKRGHLHVPVIT